MAPRRITRELLVEAARNSTTWDDAVRWCGGTPTRYSRRYLRARMAAEDIDTAHFPSGRVRYSDDLLRRLVAESSSVAEVVRRLGISPVGGNQAHIGRRVRALAPDTSHFGQARRRGTRTAETGLVLGSRADGRTPGERLRRWLLSTGVAEVCALCGIPAVWNSRPLRLEVDHLSGEWWDNRPANLRLLCPNCHTTTDTFRGRRRTVSSVGAVPVPRVALTRAVANARTMDELLETLHIPDTESERARIRRRIARYGLDSSHFTGRGTHRSVPDTRLPADLILRREEPGGSRRKTVLLRRALTDIGVRAVCALCGVDDTWQGRELILEIDHINGERLDNRAENLRFLCPSCHSQTSTFSKNRASHRSAAVPRPKRHDAATQRPRREAVARPRKGKHPAHEDEELTAAVAVSAGWADLMRRLGVRASTGRRRTLQRRVAELELDTSHFKQRSAWRSYPDEAIVEAVASSADLREVVQKVCARISVGALAHIERRIAASGIDTSHFTDLDGTGRELPFTDAQLSEAAGPGRSVREVARRLGVADDTQSRKVLRHMLERLGYVYGAARGKTAPGR